MSTSMKESKIEISTAILFGCILVLSTMIITQSVTTRNIIKIMAVQ